jgi:hypothetical protein
MSIQLTIHSIVKVTKRTSKLTPIGGGIPFNITTLRVYDEKGLETEISLFSDEPLEFEELQ